MLTPEEQLIDLLYDRNELASEVRRHHLDFGKIRAILDFTELDRELTDAERQIRNVVG